MPVRSADAHASWYEGSTPPLPSQPRLQGRERADVAILGGGLTGLCTALELAARGFSVVIVEAGTVGSGASGRNGGQVLFGFGCDHAVIRAQLGDALAKDLFD